MTKLMLVEDDPTVREPLTQHLIKAGFSVTACASLKESRCHSLEFFHLLILDWELPDGEGIDYLRELRASGHHLPVIFLTARTELLDKVLGLELGADDYVTKPFEIKELVARIRTRLRQKTSPRATKLEMAQIIMDLGSHRVTYKGKNVELAKMEFALLKFFLENPDKALVRDEILNKVWGFENFPSTRTVDSHILILRQKFDADLFETLRGVGYRFKVSR